MKITIISVFPELHESFINTSLVARAVDAGIVKFNLLKLSQFCPVKERIDEPTCGPGPGMIIKPELLQLAIDHAQDEHGPGFKIFFSPQGQRLDQHMLQKFAEKITPQDTSKTLETMAQNPDGHLILVCARYEGIDARVEQEYADASISIGDYVLMGGDLPAQVLLEGLLRLIPGVVGNEQSVEQESFKGPFLDHPHYGLPVEWKGKRIPDIVRSGNHEKINQWRQEQACKKTLLTRFDWLRTQSLTDAQTDLCKQQIPNHYVALLHSQIRLKDNESGHTSIASLDIHDGARSCATYGIENYFVVSCLKDQQKILQTFLQFWHSEEGKKYNKSRYDAVAKLIPSPNLDHVIETIRQKEGQSPLIISTSAKYHGHGQVIDYHSQGTVWQHNRPVLILFGTGLGLADEVLEQSDFLLTPVAGMSNYRHLSVRAAIAIVLDRWLGLNKKLSM
ncbi:MAG: tRNA (guanosine(37)-N1)-methyltransferase TrmD [Epsilonproteobacteria bacterium]|nr:tRNA (guanosine(37)-N1)-methyltransferase TrmD [Campylobacterota bacterium]